MVGFLDVCKFLPTLGGLTDWTYSSTVAGNQSPTQAAAVNGEIYRYRAENAAATEWEIGYGPYNSATGVFSRSTVLWSSGVSNAKVNFSTVPKVAITFIAQDLPREKLTAARTYFVRSDGSNSNTGLVNSAAGAFLTGQAAIDAAAKLDLGTFNCTIQFVNVTTPQTYTGNLLVTSAPVTAGGVLILQGDTTTPANLVLSPAAGDAIKCSGLGSTIDAQGFKLLTASGAALFATLGGQIRMTGKIEFGACTNHMSANYGGIIIAQNGGTYTITGAAANHMLAINGAFIQNNGQTCTITGTPAFSTAFVSVSFGAAIESTTTFSGAATGQRFAVQSGGNLSTGSGANTTFFPGNVDGFAGGPLTGGGTYDGTQQPGGNPKWIGLNADFTMANALGAQKCFSQTGATNGAVAISGNTTYEFEAQYVIAETGTTSHTWGILFGGTATITSGYMEAIARTAAAVGTITAANLMGSTTLGTSLVCTGAITLANTTIIKVRGRVRINAAGTWIPQVAASAAPGVAPVMKANSYFEMWPISSGGVLEAGSWS